jgi:histidyl-tRNA synthetase
MANKSKFQAIRGTRDLLPPETALWNRAEQTAHEVFSTYGFGEIRPPLFEDTELFARSIGVDTDIVAKEMYSFEDRQRFDPPDFGSLKSLAALINIVTPSTEPNRMIPDNWKTFVDEYLDHQTDVLLSIRSHLQRFKEAYESGELPQTRKNEETFTELSNLTLQIIGAAKTLSDSCQRQAVVPRLVPLITSLLQAFEHFDLGVPLTLRPEATASVCRAYIEHNMQQLPQPVKLHYMGPMFRRERPQKGRYRQFYQIGAEILGGPDAPAIDAELIEMLMTFFDKCGLQGTELSINSIGHAADNCRRGYVAKLKAELEKVKDKLGADSQRRIETNPLRVLDSKLEHEQPIIEKLPRIADHLCDECKAHYAAVKRELELRGVIYRENWRLVRGLDYYMRTTFEITAQGLGSQNAVCGGGRYDGLVELLGGPPTKGIGFAIGEDRLILSLQEQAKAKALTTGEMSAAITGKASVTGTLTNLSAPDVFIAWMGQNAYATAIRAAKTLRNAGFRVELPPVEQKFGKALERASKLGSRFALILGDNEVADGQWTLKTLTDGSQQKLTEPALLEYLRKQ